MLTTYKAVRGLQEPRVWEDGTQNKETCCSLSEKIKPSFIIEDTDIRIQQGILVQPMNADKGRDLVCWGRCGRGRRTHWATLMAVAARSCLHGREGARSRVHGCTDVWGRCRGHTGCCHGCMDTRSRFHGHKYRQGRCQRAHGPLSRA